jgi:hypothetical protein
MGWPKNLAIQVLVAISLLILACLGELLASPPEKGDKLSVYGVMADTYRLVCGQYRLSQGRDRLPVCLGPFNSTITTSPEKEDCVMLSRVRGSGRNVPWGESTL